MTGIVRLTDARKHILACLTFTSQDDCATIKGLVSKIPLKPWHFVEFRRELRYLGFTSVRWQRADRPYRRFNIG